MKIKIMNVPVLEPESGTAELNSFLASHRITTVEKAFASQNGTCFWSFVITYSQGSPLKAEKEKSKKIDYREVLDVDQFARYATLREMRNDMAKKEGKPPYAIFTNEQLSKMAIEQITTKSALASIDGVGAARIEQYAETFLVLLCQMKKDKQV